MRNLEIKARYDDHDTLVSLLNSFGATFIQDLHQKDTYFSVPNGRLKLREIDDTDAELIYYERPEHSTQRWSDYYKYPVEHPEKLVTFFNAFLPTSVVVDKKRSLYKYKNARIHVDTVVHLGSFIEIEVEVKGDSKAQAQMLMQNLLSHLEIPKKDFIKCSYSDLLLRK